METRRGKLELDIEGRKELGQIQYRNHTSGGVGGVGTWKGWERFDT